MHALLHLLTNRHFARQTPARDAATTRGILILAALCSGDHSAYHIVSPCSLAELGRLARVRGLYGIWLENGMLMDGGRASMHIIRLVGAGRINRLPTAEFVSPTTRAGLKYSWGLLYPECLLKQLQKSITTQQQ